MDHLGREVNGQTFYVPLYPCVIDFSAIPAIEIPVDSSPQFLIPQIADHINAGGDATCNGEVYDFSDLAPACLQYLPFTALP